MAPLEQIRSVYLWTIRKDRKSTFTDCIQIIYQFCFSDGLIKHGLHSNHLITWVCKLKIVGSNPIHASSIKSFHLSWHGGVVVSAPASQ